MIFFKPKFINKTVRKRSKASLDSNSYLQTVG